MAKVELTKSINDKEIEPLHGCPRGTPFCRALRQAPIISACAYTPSPADANGPRGMEASATVSWLFYSLPLPLAGFSSAPCHAATNWPAKGSEIALAPSPQNW